jgi:hypothetical protein
MHYMFGRVSDMNAVSMTYMHVCLSLTDMLAKGLTCKLVRVADMHVYLLT